MIHGCEGDICGAAHFSSNRYMSGLVVQCHESKSVQFLGRCGIGCERTDLSESEAHP
jgi:hypothetical protein